MKIQDFYIAVGGNYDTIVSQMLTEERVRKYIKKFLDGNTYQKLLESMEQKDYENAFLQAHNLKGMSNNICFKELAQASSELTESLRGGPKGDVEGLFAVVKEKYEKVAALIPEIEP